MDEENNLLELYERLTRVLSEWRYRYQIIFIDDGSTDSSFEVFQKIQNSDEKIKIIRFRRNFGKAAAYSAGFRYASGDIVVTMDGDLQDDPEEIVQFIKKIEQGFDMVVGWRFNRQDTLGKKLSSRFFNIVVAFFSGLRLHDFNCAYKAYRKEVLEEIRIYSGLYRYIPILADAKGFLLTELKTHNHPRKSGKSKYGLERHHKGMMDFITVLFLTKFGNRPLHLLGFGGMLTLAIGLGIIGILVGAHFSHSFGILSDPSWNIHDRPVLSLGILLIIVGVQFFSMGLLGDLFITQNRSEHSEEAYSILEILASPETEMASSNEAVHTVRENYPDSNDLQ